MKFYLICPMGQNKKKKEKNIIISVYGMTERVMCPARQLSQAACGKNFNNLYKASGFVHQSL